MKKLDSILVATDFSSESTKALQTGLSWARKLGAKLHLIHVDTSLSFSRHIPEFEMLGRTQIEQISKAFYESEKASLDRQVSTLGISDTEVHCEILEGNIEDVVLRYVDDHQIGLVLLGAKGHGLVEEVLLGSSSEKLMKRLPVPLVVVRGEGAVIPSRIMFLTDFGVSSEEAKNFTALLGQSFQSEVIVFHVLEPIWDLVEFGVNNRLFGDFEHSEGHAGALISREEAEAKVRTLLQSNVTYFKEKGLRTEGHVEVVRMANTAKHLVEAIGSTGPDLVVMGTHGRGGLTKLILGSVAERVMEKSPCSVALYRHQSK